MTVGLGLCVGGARKVFGRQERREGGDSCSSPPTLAASRMTGSPTPASTSSCGNTSRRPLLPRRAARPGRAGPPQDPRPVSHPRHSPWLLAAWPDVPTKFVLCTEDRFFPPSSCTASSPTASASPPTRSPPVIARRSAVRRNWSTCSPDTPLHKPVWNRDKAELLTCGLQVSGGSQEVRKIRWRWVRDSARVFVRVHALGCPVGCMRRALVRLVLVLPVLLAAAVLGAASAVSGLARRPRSGLALTQRTRPRSSCSRRTSPSLEVIRAYGPCRARAGMRGYPCWTAGYRLLPWPAGGPARGLSISTVGV